MLQSSLLVVLLEHFRGAADVAAFRAVMPIAGLNLVVFQSFAFLFTPLAARLFARKDRKGLHELYWQTAAWIAVLSFPVFAATVSLARPLTLLLYGGRYEQSALLLAVLSLGHYFNAALGFNGHTLRVFSKVRYLVRADLLGAVVSLGMTVALIVRYGSLGAAIGASGSLVAQNLLYQAGLRLGTGIPVFEWRYLGVYLAILLGALGLLLVQLLFAPPVYVAFTLLLVVSCTVVRSSRGSLNVEQTFPEVLRFPLARWLFAV